MLLSIWHTLAPSSVRSMLSTSSSASGYLKLRHSEPFLHTNPNEEKNVNKRLRLWFVGFCGLRGFVGLCAELKPVRLNSGDCVLGLCCFCFVLFWVFAALLALGSLVCLLAMASGAESIYLVI